MPTIMPYKKARSSSEFDVIAQKYLGLSLAQQELYRGDKILMGTTMWMLDGELPYEDYPTLEMVQYEYKGYQTRIYQFERVWYVWTAEEKVAVKPPSNGHTQKWVPQNLPFKYAEQSVTSVDRALAKPPSGGFEAYVRMIEARPPDPFFLEMPDM